MSESEPRQAAMDALLRRSMAAPAPALSGDFHPRLRRALQRRSEPPRFGRLLLGSYGALSGLVSVVVMRGESLGWGPITVAMIGAALVLAGVNRLTRPRLRLTIG